MPLPARSGTFFFFCLKLELRESVFAVISPPYAREGILDVLERGLIIRYVWRYGYPLGSCLWVRQIIDWAGLGLACTFPTYIIASSLVRLDYNEHHSSLSTHNKNISLFFSPQQFHQPTNSIAYPPSLSEQQRCLIPTLSIPSL